MSILIIKQIKINNIKIYFFIVILMMFINVEALSLTDNYPKYIYINSMQQTVNIVENTVIFKGKVIVHYGSININADKIIISKLDVKNGNEIIECYGNPIIFYQFQHNGTKIQGSALKVSYDIANEVMIFTDEVYLKHLNSSIKGDKIIYLLKERKMEIISKEGNKVTTLINIQDKLR